MIPTIGILDADLGGLGLVKSLARCRPGIGLHYLADTAHRPMGDRGAALIRRRFRQGVAYLRARGADPVVVASQSMAAAAFEVPPEAVVRDVLDPLAPAASAAAVASATGRIGLVAGRAVVAAGAYGRLLGALRPGATLHGVAAPLLVPLLDAGWERRPETRMIVKKALHRLKVRQVDVLILGGSPCATLAPLMQRKIGSRVRLIDPLACLLESLLPRLPTAAESPGAPARRIEVTDRTPAVDRRVRAVLGRCTPITEVRL